MMLSGESSVSDDEDDDYRDGSLKIDKMKPDDDDVSSDSHCVKSDKNDADKSCDDKDGDQTVDSTGLEHEKQQIYRHPLFPLLALLLEKCEKATATLGTSDSVNLFGESFNSEIKEFIANQEKENVSLYTEDSEVDTLMITAIQVLRIHLLELGKVQELCRDFCQRYISCLRGKMNSENLLRDAGGVPNNRSLENSSCTSSSDVEECSNSSSYLAGDTNGCSSTSSGTHRNFSESLARPENTRTSFAEAIEVSKNHNQRVDSGTEGDLSDEASNVIQKRNQKRGILPKQATAILRSWLFQHIVHPYPTEDEKKAIAAETNLTLLQVNNWFINARRRILQPMLDSANISSTSKEDINELKEKEHNQSRKFKGKNIKSQRFWPESMININRVTEATKNLSPK